MDIGKPTKWNPDQYVVISKWEDEAALVDFVGEPWNQAHIPEAMEKFVKQCWVHHYYDYGSA